MASELDSLPVIATRKDEAVGALQQMVSKGLGWARKYSLFQYPFVTACCGMEFMAVAAARYDLDRFGAALPRFSPRQADLLMVVGTINVKQAPILRRVYDSMAVCKGPSLGTTFTLACPFTLLAHYGELDWAESCGVSRYLIRISVGLEDPEDLWQRLDTALKVA